MQVGPIHDGEVGPFLQVDVFRKGYETVDEDRQGPEGIGGIDLVAMALVFVDATVRIGCPRN